MQSWEFISKHSFAIQLSNLDKKMWSVLQVWKRGNYPKSLLFEGMFLKHRREYLTLEAKSLYSHLEVLKIPAIWYFRNLPDNAMCSNQLILEPRAMYGAVRAFCAQWHSTCAHFIMSGPFPNTDLQLWCASVTSYFYLIKRGEKTCFFLSITKPLGPTSLPTVQFIMIHH